MTKIRTSKLVVNTALLDSTDTNLTGILKGIAGKVTVATPDTDFTTPASVALKVSKASNLSDLADRQAALNNLAGAGVGNESKVLAQDPTDGNIKLMTPAASGGSSDVLTYDFPLNETITADKIVQLLASGKIESVKAVSQTETVPNGAATDYQTTGYFDPVVKFDPNNANRFVVAFTEMFQSYTGAIRAGTISGTTITFGTKLQMTWADTQSIDIDFCKNPADTIIIVYKDNGNSGYATAVAATIAANLSITLGSSYVFSSTALQQVRVVCNHSTMGMGVIAFQNSGGYYLYFTSFKITGISTLTIPGATTNTYVGTSNCGFTISASKKDPLVLASFTYTSQSAAMAIYLNTDTGSTFASALTTVLSSGSAGVIEFDKTGTTNDFLVVYLNSNYAKAKTGTVSYSGSTPAITLYSTENVVTAKAVTLKAVAGDNLTSGKFFVIYSEFSSPNWYTRAMTLTMSGASVTAGTERTVVASNPAYRLSATISWGNAGQVLIVKDGSLYQALMGLSVSNISKPNVLGFLKTGGIANDIRTVKLLGGVIAGFAGLTPGVSYYIQPDGTVTATSTDSRCLYLGKAISATAILTRQNL